MSQKQSFIAGKSLWTTGTYAASTGVRFVTNIVLSYLLGPEILGVVVIAQAVRVGAELLTDMGMEQNVVSSDHGDREEFLNTVWTLQILRGVLIASVCAACAYFIAAFYDVQTGVIIAISATPFLNALASTSVYTLTKNAAAKQRGLFELGVDAIGLAINVALALALRNIWAPILGILLTVAARSALSYALPHPPHRFHLDKGHGLDIFHYSKWVMFSSLLFFCAIYADRLFIGRSVGLAALGNYGLARAISDIPQTLASRLGTQVLFPSVARNRTGAHAAARADLSMTRRNLLLVVALGMATVMAWSDWGIEILYDRRYREAGWMLFLLLGGGWLGVLAALNEATLFGHARPKNVSIANLVRVLVLAAALPGSFWLFGLAGAVAALPASELARYAALRVAQRGLSETFGGQDAVTTLVFLALLVGWLALRLSAGLGMPWQALG